MSSKLVTKQNVGNVVTGVKNISAHEAEAFGQGLFGKNANIKLEGFISPKPE